MVDIVEMKYLITNSLKFHLNQLYLTTHTIVLVVISLINDLTKPSDVYESINSMEKIHIVTHLNEMKHVV